MFSIENDDHNYHTYMDYYLHNNPQKCMHFRTGTRHVLTCQSHAFREKMNASRLPNHMDCTMQGLTLTQIIQEDALRIVAIMSTGTNTAQDQTTRTVKQFVLIVSSSQCISYWLI